MKKTVQITIAIVISALLVSCSFSIKKQSSSESVKSDIHVDISNSNDLEATLKHIAYFDSDTINRLAAVQKLTNESYLKHVAYFDTNTTVRKRATQKISREDYLKHIAYFDVSPTVRQIATSKIASQKILSHIAKFDKDVEVRRTAVAILTNTRN